MRINKTEKQNFERLKESLLSDNTICKANRELFEKYFEQQEVVLKRKNNLSKLDEANYKTLNKYVWMFRNVNSWFNNKPLASITEKDIAKVYNDLEDEKIKQKNDKPYSLASRITYYNKIFKSELFRMIEKDNLSKKVMKFTPRNQAEVRFITEEDFRKIVDNANKPEHKLLIWLSWDIGENINSLLKLKKEDLTKQNNPYTKEIEYKVNLRKDILKRSRKARGEITNYLETVKLLEQILPKVKDNGFLFNYDYNNAKKILLRAIARTDVKCKPNGERPSWKDLRSGMACDLLKKGWTTDEVNARLGHKPSSDEIDKYVNFLAIDRHTPKKKVHQFEMEKLNEELQDIKKREKLQAERNEALQEEMKQMKAMMLEMWKQGKIKKP